MSKNLKTGIIFIVILVAVALLVTFAFDSGSTDSDMINSQTSAGSETINPNAGGETSNTASTTLATYTLAQVMTHKIRTDCWTTINGGVYNVTTWIDQHPGGAQAIIGLCGIDGSDAFNGQHGGQPRPATELAGFKIGTLIK